MFCTNCGKEVSEGIKFCPNCGQVVLKESTLNDENSAKASEENSSSDKYETVATMTENNSAGNSVPDYMNEDFISAYLDTEKDSDSYKFYKKAFAKYNESGVEKFAFVWSWWGFFTGGLLLVHRRLYLEFIVWLIVSMLLSGSTSGLLAVAVLVAGGLLPPFLVYKKFMRVLSKCNDMHMDESQKIQMLKDAGGISSLAGLIIIGLLFVGIITGAAVVFGLIFGDV